MLQSENERLTRVGPGTEMGTLLRRFWMPALLERELAEPDGPPVRLRLLGEDLVAFRDSKGRIGILEAACAHRRASLYFARNEDCGLRCIYHGWKYDVDGNCVDIPSEPDGGETLKPMAKRVSYPNAVRGGAIWVYMGPRERMPEPPQFEWSMLPERQRTATKRLQFCNWAQAVEGGIDSAHVSFLHSRVAKGAEQVRRNPLLLVDKAPVFEVKEVPYGLLIAARRRADERNYYWRITQFLLPFFQMIPPTIPDENSSRSQYSGHAWIPIDDERTWTWTFSANPHRAYTDEELALHGGDNGIWGPIDEQYVPRRNRMNDYLLDRKAQKDGLFAGIEGIPNQDAAVQESMGPITDRTREVLGHSDRAVVLWRRLMLRLAAECAEGREPEAARHGEWYNVRSASLLLAQDVPFEDGAAQMLKGAAPRQAAE
jgi:phenylpropionate dioxygenase-like ring-hydroxylating dioxygenase large terminal subunit